MGIGTRSLDLLLVVRFPPCMACPGVVAGNGCSVPDQAVSLAQCSSELLANDAEIFVAGVAGHAPCVFPTGTESSRQSPGVAASPQQLSFN